MEVESHRMKRNTTSIQVVIVLTEHPLFGVLLTPYTAEKLANGIIQLIEQAFHASHEAMECMNDTERQAIEIASHYTEKYLMGVYSRETNISKFLRKLSDEPEKIKTTIRPFIEKKLQEMLELILTQRLPFYQKQSGSKLLYPHHAFVVNQQDAEIHFSCHVNEEFFSYQLQCYYNDELIPLTELKPVVVLTSSPTTLLLGMELYRFPHIESSRLLPFTKKTRINVGAELTEKYIDNIIIPIARYHDVRIEGIHTVRDKRECEALLYLEDTIYSETLLRLDFRYGKERYTPQTTREIKKIVIREEVEGKPAIRYFERDSRTEAEAIRLLCEAGLERISDSHFQISPNSPNKSITEWIARHREMLQQHFLLTSSIQEKPYALDEIRIEQNFEDGPDWFDLHITAIIGELRIPFSRFRKHILEDRREYTLPDGRIIILPEEWFSKYANLLEIGTEKEKNIRIKREFIGIVHSLIKEDTGKQEQEKTIFQLLPAPTGLKAELRPYQQKGFSWMMYLCGQHFGGCLADDMGLGKTLQTLTLLQAIYGTRLDKDSTASHKPATLIVVPTSLIHNWQRETSRFTTLSTAEYNSSSPIKPEYPESFFDRFQLIFTTYGMMRNNIGLLSKYRFEYVVLDESQNIKNSDSLTFRSAIQLVSNHRLTLTGTPIENSLKDLWAQFRFLQPGLLGDETTFNKQFIAAIRQGNPRMEARLRQIISPFILRRTKNEVAPELPLLTEEVIYCGMPDAQKEIYEQEKNSLRNTLLQLSTEDTHNQPLTVLNGISRLRQLACHPRMISSDFTGSSGKLEQIMETFETLRSEGHKVLIFSSFVKHLELVIAEFLKRRWAYSLLTGATTNRSAEISRFNDNKEIQAFFISLKAGGVGLNLTQADYVFIIDPWWNPAAEAQAISRAHRIGQDKQVIAYRFITQDSIEEKIIHLQEEKRKLAATFISDGESLPELTENEWAELLN